MKDFDKSLLDGAESWDDVIKILSQVFDKSDETDDVIDKDLSENDDIYQYIDNFQYDLGSGSDLVNESAFLNDRIMNFNNYIRSSGFLKLPENDQYIIKYQLYIMKLYRDCLIYRLDNELY